MRDTIDVAQFARRWKIDPLMRFSRPPVLGVEPQHDVIVAYSRIRPVDQNDQGR